jgi:hypothetical protein
MMSKAYGSAPSYRAAVRRAMQCNAMRCDVACGRAFEQSPSRLDPYRLRYLMQESASCIDQQSGRVPARISLRD